MTITSRVRKVVFSNMPSQFLEGLQSLLSMLKDVERGLLSAVLCGHVYEAFSHQEDLLKVKS